MIGLPMKNAAASLLLIVSLFVLQASAWVPSCVPSLSKKQVAFGGSSTRLFSGEDGSSSIHTGTVKWFDTTKGFGFIVPSDGSGDVFVHQSEIQMQGFRSLADGEAVEYKVATDPKTGRKKAIAVTGPDGAEVKGAPFRPTSDYESY